MKNCIMCTRAIENASLADPETGDELHAECLADRVLPDAKNRRIGDAGWEFVVCRSCVAGVRLPVRVYARAAATTSWQTPCSNLELVGAG
jgi:hypothetical protein